MNKRDYLRSLGYTVGERGRFSTEMLADLAAAPAGSYTEDKPKPVKAPKAPKAAATAKPTPAVLAQRVVKVAPLPERPVVRPQETLWAVTPTGNGTHAAVGYDSCYAPGCNQSVSRCACKAGPRPPAGAIPVKSYADAKRL